MIVEKLESNVITVHRQHATMMCLAFMILVNVLTCLTSSASSNTYKQELEQSKPANTKGGAPLILNKSHQSGLRTPENLTVVSDLKDYPEKDFPANDEQTSKIGDNHTVNNFSLEMNWHGESLS